MYATGVGLILWEMQHMHRNGITQSRSGHGWQWMRERVVEWIREFF